MASVANLFCGKIGEVVIFRLKNCNREVVTMVYKPVTTVTSCNFCRPL